MRALPRAALVATVILAGVLIIADGSAARGSMWSAAGGKGVAGTAAVLGKNKALAILGKPVTSATGENMGRIVDVIVDKTAMPRAAIIDFGGFLGVGSRKIAVDWNALHFSPAGKAERITLGLTRDQLKAAPEYQKGKPVVVMSASGGTLPMPTGEYPLDQQP